MSNAKKLINPEKIPKLNVLRLYALIALGRTEEAGEVAKEPLDQNTLKKFSQALDTPEIFAQLFMPQTSEESTPPIPCVP